MIDPHELTPLQSALLGELEQCAAAGDRLPSHAELTERIGATNGHTASLLIALDRKGSIILKEDDETRCVTITRTGLTLTGVMPATRRKRMMQMQNINHTRSPCFNCGARPDACECGA